MTTPENNLSDSEGKRDLAWIEENLPLFWQTAVQGARLMGRGAIMVDVEGRPMGSKNLFTYFSLEELARFEDAEMQRLVRQYRPDDEFVLILLKPEARTRSYQIQPQRRH